MFRIGFRIESKMLDITAKVAFILSRPFKVREYIENYNENKTHFALTGTLGTYGWMNQDNPNQ